MTSALRWLGDRHLLVANHALLFLFASIYLGTGLSLALFQFPSFPELTVANYYLYVVPPVERATAFFTYMTMAMYITGGLLLAAELRTRLRWAPVIVLAGLTASTMLTVVAIFDLNAELRSGITDQARLNVVMGTWLSYNVIRVSLWIVMWVAIMVYFAVQAAPAIRGRS